MPPPDTTIRRRNGYHAVDSDDLPSVSEPPQELAEDSLESSIPVDDDTREAVQEGWFPLIWSFAVAGLLTVC